MTDLREEIILHYMTERELSREFCEKIIPTDPWKVAYIYDVIQKEKEDSKNIGIRRVVPPVGNLDVWETYRLDEDVVQTQEESSKNLDKTV